MRGERHPDAAGEAEHGPEGTGKGSGTAFSTTVDSASVAPSSSWLRGWRRNLLLAVGGCLFALCAAVVWLALDPGLLRSAAEYVATAATGRPVVIEALDLRLVEGRTVIEAHRVRVGQTTTERVSILLTGLRSQATGDRVRFPNGSSLEQFRASIDFSLAGPPRISTVDATGAVLVAARRSAADPDGPPPLARLLVVPRILLGLGLERLVVHSGALEYRGRFLTQSAGLTAVLERTDEGLAFRGELLVGPEVPALPFDGTVRDPMIDEWRIDVRLHGDRVPMEGVRFLAGVLEPGPTVRATLRRISSEAQFLLSGRVARGRIESATLDFTFDPPGKADDPGISLEDVRFVASAIPDPAGWTVTGEIDWSRLPGGAGAERSPFVIRWSTGVPGSLRWSARRVPIPLLAPLARSALPSDHALRPALERLRPAGWIEELAAFGDPGASGDASFWLSAVVSGFGATAGPWRISETGARVEFVGGEWRVRFVNDRLDAAIPSFRSAPYGLTLEGEVRIAPAGKGWAAHTRGLGFTVAGIAGHVSGSVAAPLADEGGAPVLDAEIRLDDVALADIGAVLPDRRAIAFTRWYRRAVRSGRLTGATVRIRGDPRSIPFPDGDGEFVAKGTFREVEFAYAEGWPAVLIEEAEARADGPRLAFSGIRGSIFDSAIEQGSARLADTTDPAGRVRVSLAGSGPARDLLAFVRASPLRTQTGGPAPDLRAEGPASISAELDVPYGRGAADRPFEVSGKIALDGVALRLAGRRAVLEDVRGDLEFDAESLSGGPLLGRFRDRAIDTRVEFDRGRGLVLRFSGKGDREWFGTALEDLVDLGREESDPWLTPIRGPAAWNAEYRSRSGIVFRSDLHGASVEFPAPFEKPADTARPLEVILTPGETEWRIDATWGADVKGRFEVAETDGEWALARAGIVLGGGPPALPDAGHVEVSGELADLDLDPWLALGGAGAHEPDGWLSRIGRISLDTAGTRVLGHRVALGHLELTLSEDRSELHLALDGEGVAGVVRFPVDPASGAARIRLERLYLDDAVPSGKDVAGESPEEEPPGEAGSEFRPERWPSFDARIASLRFEKLDVGTFHAIGKRTEHGIRFEELRTRSSDLRMDGRGAWLAGEDGIPASRFEATVQTGNLMRLLSAAGLDEETAAGGSVEIRFDLAWPDAPFEPSLDKLEGTITMRAENGHLPRVRVGPIGRLFALLSLEALPRVLALDLSHVFGKGLAYDRISVRTRIEGGSANIREFTISGPSAQIEVSGKIDLFARQYDQEITVIPRVTRSGALLPVWIPAWPVLAANFLLEKAVGGDEIILDRLFRLRYRLEGPLDDPEIERIPARSGSGGKE